MTDTQKLREKIDETGITITALAKKCGVTRETLYSKISGDSEFKAPEIHAMTVALHLSRDERDAIFFKC